MENMALFELLRSIEKTRQMVLDEIRSRNIDWRHLVVNDMRIEAVMAYRKQHGTSLTESKEIVDAFAEMMR